MLKFLFTFLFTTFSYHCFSQHSKNDSLKTDNSKVLSFKDKCYVGGDVIFYLSSSSGNNGLLLNLSPMFGYRPNNKNFSYGVGLTYQYTSITYPGLGASFSNHLYGGRVFARQLIGNVFFLHGEAETYLTKKENYLTRKMEFASIPFVNGFIGFKNRFSQYSYYYFMIGYNFLENPNGIYVYATNPLLLKVGYVFDLGGN